MPAALLWTPSVAPVSRIGTIGTPGHSLAASFSIGPMIAGVSGGGGETLLGSWARVTATGAPASSASLARTSSTGVPGRMRQLTLAVARWGRALGAWPALTMVATQVVRSIEFHIGSAVTT